MSSVEEFYENADECFGRAKTTKTEGERKSLSTGPSIGDVAFTRRRPSAVE